LKKKKQREEMLEQTENAKFKILELIDNVEMQAIT